VRPLPLSRAAPCSCATPHPGEGECPTLLRARGAASGTLLFVPSLADASPRARLAAQLQPGDRLGSYRVLRALAEGGMGRVYLAEHVLIGKQVALKVLHAHLAADADLVQRFLSEARAVSRIQHANVVQVFDLELRDGRPYLVMEYLEGQSLAEHARGPLAPARAVALLAQVCDALAAAHACGIIHRDLKPSNVHVLSQADASGAPRVKLIDFGIAKQLAPRGGERGTWGGQVLGTPEFMAPEQADEGPVDARTDVYAAGILGYLLLTGRLPFTGAHPTEVLLAHLQHVPPPAHALCPAVPQALSAVLQRAMARRPAERYGSALELKRALESALAAPAAPARFSARVLAGAGASRERLPCERVGRSGLLLHSAGTPPPLFAQVGLLLQLPGGELPCVGQVVRHVTAEQARAWGMAPGFGVELRDVTPALQDAFTRLLAGERLAPPMAPAPAARECPDAERTLRDFRKRQQGSHYVVLGAPPNASTEALRDAGRACRRTLEALLAGTLSGSQRAQAECALERVGQALHQLGQLERRVDYDAGLGNLEGIARCLAEGLTVTQLEQARRRYLAEARRPSERSERALAAVRNLEGAGQRAAALLSCEDALREDPLHLELVRRYRTLRLR
jgi:eukaryotic-like serine/threonine-protein kinase